MRFFFAAALLLLVGGALLWSPGIAWAAEWSVVPEVTAKSAFDSNLNFSLRRRASDFILGLAPSASLSSATEAAQLQGVVGLNGLHYLSHSNLDHIDQNVQINGYYQAAPCLKLSLTGAYVSDSTLLEELTASGLIIGRTVRQSLQVGPGMTYNLSERLLLNLGYGFSQVSYRSPLLLDYATQRVSLGLNYLLNNDRSTLRGVVLGRFISYPEVSNDFQSLGMYLGAEHKFSENWAGSCLAGVNVTRASLSTQVTDFSNFPFFILVRQARRQETAATPYLDISTTRRWANADLTGGYVLDIASSGSGAIYEFNRAFLTLSYQFTERLTGRLGGNLYYHWALFPGTTGHDLVFTASPELNYKLREKLTLSSGYYFGWRQNYVADVSAPRNMVSISLNYANPMHFQR